MKDSKTMQKRSQ